MKSTYISGMWNNYGKFVRDALHKTVFYRTIKGNVIYKMSKKGMIAILEHTIYVLQTFFHYMYVKSAKSVLKITKKLDRD